MSEREVEIIRDEKGRVLPGRSLNPGGRPRQVRELLSLARTAVPRALELAASYVDDERMDARVRLEAAKLLLSYGLGAPPKLPSHEEDEIEAAALRAMSDADLERLVRQHLVARSKRDEPDPASSP